MSTTEELKAIRERNAAYSGRISAGNRHIARLQPDGTVLAEGDQSDGKCRVDSWRDVVAVSAGSCCMVGVKADGTVVSAGDYRLNLCLLDDWRGIVAVSAGESHIAGLKADGTAVGIAGLDVTNYGQYFMLGWRDITAVSARGLHTVGLKSDGTVVAAGYGKDGQCDVGDWADMVAVSAGGSHTVGLKAEGTVLAAGSNEDGQCDVGAWRDVVAVSAGRSHTAGLKADGTVLAAGSNAEGQCDVGAWRDIVAVSAGDFFTAGLRADGSIVTAGEVDYIMRSPALAAEDTAAGAEGSRLLLISGPSGVGKGPMVDTLFTYAKANGISIQKHVLYTNRPKRQGETDGVTYHYVDTAALEQNERNHPESFKTFQVYEQRQGMDIACLKAELAENDLVLLEIYYACAPDIKAFCEEQGVAVTSVFIQPLSDEDYEAAGCAGDAERACVTCAVMLNKLINRATEPYAKALKRAQSAYAEIKGHRGYDCDIVNPYGEDNRTLWSLLKEFLSVPGGLEAALKHGALRGIAEVFQGFVEMGRV